MLDACRFLVDFTAGKAIEDYRTDRPFRSAVEREFQNIGEALRQLQTCDPSVAEKLTEYQRIIRFRHALVHGYDVVKPELVWGIIEEKLPLLRDELECLLKVL